LDYVDAETAVLQGIAEYYLNNITNSKIILPSRHSRESGNPPANGGIAGQARNDGQQVAHVWHVFAVRCEQRDALQKHLEKHNIQTQIHYPIPPHKQACYANTPLAELHLPITEQIHQEILSLPMSPVMTQGEIQAVVDVVNAF
jgi:dTDP-4-amino-4,6-dideoxygalactose transaminase